MALSLYNIKKWYRMLTGKSVLHVQQDLGKVFETGKLRGYFNNMTQKVTMEPALLETEALPLLKTEQGEDVYFPVAVFQYGLGAWDLFLQTGDDRYEKKFLQCANWALEKQEETGAWNNFFFYYPEHPYGAMCQGEGISLLLRAWQHTKEETYFTAAKKAVDFMMLPVEQGGTALYTDGMLQLLEYTHRPVVLNGWAFALFGLYDWTLVCDEQKYKNLLEQTLASLCAMLPEFDNGYWSIYDAEGRIASPFYHDLHIAQMQALHMITGNSAFADTANRWQVYKNKTWNSTRAFAKKAWQKIAE